MKSKEKQIIELFFENPTKEWHFENIIQESKITKSKANNWLKKFTKNQIIKRIKPKGKMPYYISNFNSPEYKNRKKVFAFNKLHEIGLLNHLSSLKKIQTAIIFGSFTRSDWYKDSDIDIFIYGNPEGLRIVNFELKLHKDIQVFICQNKKELSKLGKGLIKNIVKGNIVKGNLDFIEVGISA